MPQMSNSWRKQSEALPTTTILWMKLQIQQREKISLLLRGHSTTLCTTSSASVMLLPSTSAINLPSSMPTWSLRSRKLETLSGWPKWFRGIWARTTLAGEKSSCHSHTWIDKCSENQFLLDCRGNFVFSSFLPFSTFCKTNNSSLCDYICTILFNFSSGLSRLAWILQTTIFVSILMPLISVHYLLPTANSPYSVRQKLSTGSSNSIRD